MTDVLQPGEVFAGRYLIERYLAKGGFGVVYVAEQVETELRVALKVLWPHVVDSHEAVEKFKLEARVAGRVGSEHIVRVFDAGVDEERGMPFLAMELLSGEDLERRVERLGPLGPEETRAIVNQLAAGLDKAHGYIDRNGRPSPIVHRDLKPENLFLHQRESGESVLKILDFGIAKVLSQSTKVSHEIKGTPLYMAYEQATSGRVSAQTDIWALGLIVFFLLTGRPYWKSANSGEGTLSQLFAEVLSLDIAPASRRAAEIDPSLRLPEGFDGWFARCVCREPAERFASVIECASSLASVLGGAPSPRDSGASAPVAGPVSHGVRARARAGVGSTSSAVSYEGSAKPQTGKRVALIVGGAVAVGAAVAVGVVLRGSGTPAESFEPAPGAASAAALSSTRPKAEATGLAATEPPASPAGSASAQPAPTATSSTVDNVAKAPPVRSRRSARPAQQTAHRASTDTRTASEPANSTKAPKPAETSVTSPYDER